MYSVRGGSYYCRVLKSEQGAEPPAPHFNHWKHPSGLILTIIMVTRVGPLIPLMAGTQE